MNNEKYLPGHGLMSKSLIPFLSNLYDELNIKYNNILTEIHLLKNEATGRFLNKLKDPPFKGSLIEIALIINNKDISSKCSYDFIDMIKEKFSPREFRINVYVYMQQYDSGNLMQRISRSKLCVRSRHNDELVSKKEYLTIKDIFNESDDNMNLSFLMREYPKYSWEVKRLCAEEEPTYFESIPVEEYRMYAGIIHLWSKQNYIDIPSWVYKSLYCIKEDLIYDNNDIVPIEFRYHGLDCLEENFIHV